MCFALSFLRRGRIISGAGLKRISVLISPGTKGAAFTALSTDRLCSAVDDWVFPGTKEGAFRAFRDRPFANTDASGGWPSDDIAKQDLTVTWVTRRSTVHGMVNDCVDIDPPYFSHELDLNRQFCC